MTVPTAPVAPTTASTGAAVSVPGRSRPARGADRGHRPVPP